MLNKLGDIGIKLGTIFLAILTAAIIFVALLGMFGIGFGYLLSVWVFDWMTTNLGLDYHAANFATSVVVFLIWSIAPSLMWKFWLQKRRVGGGLAVVAFYGLIWVMISTVGSDVCFDRKTGKPLCYFVDTASGRKWSRTPGFDPSTGKAFQLYTREIKEREDREKVLENQSRKDINRSKTETVVPFSSPSSKSQTLSKTPKNQPQNQEPVEKTENFSSKWNRQNTQTAAKESEAPVVSKRQIGTLTTTEPQMEAQQIQKPEREETITIIQSTPTRTTQREQAEAGDQQENTSSRQKNKGKQKEDNPIKKVLKDEAINLINFGFEKLKRKIQ